jgi:hypothetical protein
MTNPRPSCAQSGPIITAVTITATNITAMQTDITFSNRRNPPTQTSTKPTNA